MDKYVTNVFLEFFGKMARRCASTPHHVVLKKPVESELNLIQLRSIQVCIEASGRHFKQLLYILIWCLVYSNF